MSDPLVTFAGRFSAVDDRTDAEEAVAAATEDDEPTAAFADALGAVIADLDADGSERRREAARTLYELATVAPEPVRRRGVDVVDALDDPAARPYVAGALTTALEARGPVESLVESIRPAAAASPPSPSAVRYLSWLAKNWSRDVTAAESAMADALTAADPDVREYATRFFAVAWSHHVAGREAAPALLEAAFDDENPTTRANALTAVGNRVFEYRREDESPPVDPGAVVEAAADQLVDEERVRFNAVAVLAESEHYVEGESERYWPDYADEALTARVVGALVDCLVDGSEALGERAARALSEASQSSPAALADHADALVNYAWDGDRPGRGWIRRAVRRASAARPAAFTAHAPALVERVEDDPDRDAIAVVGNVAAADLDAVAGAIEPLVDRFTGPVAPMDRRPVGEALASFYRADPHAVPDWVGPLVAALDAEDSALRRRARRNPIQTIAEVDPEAAATVLATVCSRLDDPDAVAQMAVLSSAGDVDRRAAEPAVDTLVSLVRDGDAEVAGRAVETLHGLVGLDRGADLLEPARDPVARRRDEFEGRVRDRADAVVGAVDDPDGDAGDRGADGANAGDTSTGDVSADEPDGGDGAAGCEETGGGDGAEDEQRSLRDWLPF